MTEKNKYLIEGGYVKIRFIDPDSFFGIEPRFFSGKEFNEKFRGMTFFKYFGEDDKDISYRSNHVTLFDENGNDISEPKGICETGEVFFILEGVKVEQINLNEKLSYLKRVIIPEKAQVYNKNEFYCSDIVELGDKINFNKFPKIYKLFLEAATECGVYFSEIVPDSLKDEEMCRKYIQVLIRNVWLISKRIAPKRYVILLWKNHPLV